MATPPCDTTVIFEPPETLVVECNGETATTVEWVPPEQVVMEISGTAVGLPGPPGPPGPPGSGMAVSDKPAATALGGQRAVYLTAGNTLDYADRTDPTTIPLLLGITAQAAAQGDTPLVIVYGDMVDSGWTWTPGQYVYLGTNGVLTQTPPSDGTAYILATAVTPTHIFVNIREPIALL